MTIEEAEAVRGLIFTISVLIGSVLGGQIWGRFK